MRLIVLNCPLKWCIFQPQTSTQKGLQHGTTVSILNRRIIESVIICKHNQFDRMEKIRMFTAKVGQMDYRSSLKQVKKYDLDEKKDDKVVC